jgi:hypothetical protein
MTMAELIPALKAMHANPTTAAVFADWFEDRGEAGTAVALRSKSFESGSQAVGAITHPGRIPGYDPLPIVRQAVIEAYLSGGSRD